MSYLERLRAKISPKCATPELTKLTKPGYVSFVSTHPAPSRQISAANDDSEAAPDLPLETATIEYHALIDRLMCTEEERQGYHRMANHMSPESLVTDLPKMRELVNRPANRKRTSSNAPGR